MRARDFLVILGLLGSISHASVANMTIAAIGAGGLEPVKNENISIEREDLYISPELIKVRYLFKNDTGIDIHAPILFPLPPIDAYLQANDIFVAAIEKDEGPAIDVKVSVNGKPIKVLARQRAYAYDGTEITEILRKFNINLLIERNLGEKLKKITVQEFNSVLNDNLIVYHPDSNSYAENWIVRGEYIWTQVFKANAITEVNIEYKPLTGGFFWSDFKISDDNNPAYSEKELSIDGKLLWLLPWNEKYCFSNETVSKLLELSVNGSKKDVTVLWTRYILVTARNWMGGSIGEFNLTVDKINQKSIASFCSPEESSMITKIGPTQYRITIKDFIPRNNFSLIVIDPGGGGN